ncbi:hypothetical protein BGAL_0516g00010 [Botrytis galanthina]|uniref:Uncharacterized protein n=1 Tax=Botrytis galanthina TaxID=278940 RepID=A0A4S8QJS6_9HELO|nr:hypothetical protein BGAL_0516g00010 [Botrytis galanthina]
MCVERKQEKGRKRKKKKKDKKTNQHNFRNPRKYRHGKILKIIIQHEKSPCGGNKQDAEEGEDYGEQVENADEEVLEEFAGAEIEGWGGEGGMVVGEEEK